MEADWKERITEMKAAFLESVELFLANMKLDARPSSYSSPNNEKKSLSTPKRLLGNVSPKASPVSSLYPTLIDTAKKHISRLSSILPNVEKKDDDEETLQPVITPLRKREKSPKKVTIVAPSNANETSDEEDDILELSSDEEVEPIIQSPPKRRGRSGRNTARITPSSKKIIPAQKSSRRKASAAPIEKEDGNSSEEIELASTSILERSYLRPRDKDIEEIYIDGVEVEEKPGRKSRGRVVTRTQPSTPLVSTSNSTPGRTTRTSRRKTNASIRGNSEIEEISNDDPKPVAPRTPKSVHFSSEVDMEADENKNSVSRAFSVGMDINEELDVYSPEVNFSRATPRRKTALLKQVTDTFADIDLTPTTTRGKQKRKTIAVSLLEDSVAPSPKRLKKGGRSSVAPSTFVENEPMDSNFLESDGATEQGLYSSWVPLEEISASVPIQPGIYELKVAAAKKSAYIGSCENLRQKLTLHKLKHNSGHKHLDKFIERNLSSILVRYEPLATAGGAKAEEKSRIKAFVARHKNPPAYN
ncbi:uncharacterized protein CDAR_423751 [Caerostris darwini]|uniref:GIY-YIG domain-containing protein n=1 Tax=Caerostris darwini TaxID=1538125 RepID=A0AAV4WAV8_9ARAC|nr:uncharacterized protein CDAR_423751 [Caerostris darwini]